MFAGHVMALSLVELGDSLALSYIWNALRRLPAQLVKQPSRHYCASLRQRLAHKSNRVLYNFPQLLNIMHKCLAIACNGHYQTS